MLWSGCLDLQSVTSIWTQSQHDQQTTDVLVHTPLFDDQSTRAGTIASSGTQHQTTAPSSTDSLQNRRKRKSIRQLLSNRVAPLAVCSSATDVVDGSTVTADGNRLHLPVYGKFITSSSHVPATDCRAADSGNIDSGSSNVAHVELNKDPVSYTHLTLPTKRIV